MRKFLLPCVMYRDHDKSLLLIFTITQARGAICIHIALNQDTTCIHKILLFWTPWLPEKGCCRLFLKETENLTFKQVKIPFLINFIDLKHDWFLLNILIIQLLFTQKLSLKLVKLTWDLSPTPHRGPTCNFGCLLFPDDP